MSILRFVLLLWRLHVPCVIEHRDLILYLIPYLYMSVVLI